MKAINSSTFALTRISTVIFQHRLIATAIMMGVSGSCMAEAQTTMPSTTLDELIVTANDLYFMDASEDNGSYNASVATVGTKIPSYLENLPQSVSIVTQKKIDDLNVDTLDQLAKHTTGLRVLQNDDGRSSIYARGYEYDQYSIDGLSAPMESINGNLPNLVAFDRVEVLRGPSGLFNSSSEMGGVINLVRKRASLGGKNVIQGSVSDPKSYEASIDVQNSLTSDNSVMARGIVQHKSSISDTVDDADGDPNTNTTVYGSIDKYFDADHINRIGLGYLYQGRDITPNNGLPTKANLSLIDLPHNKFYGSKENNFESESHDIFVDGRYQLASQGLVSGGLRYSKRDADYSYYFAGSSLDANNTVTLAGVGADVDSKSLSADINLSQPFLTHGRQSEFVVGADFKKYNANSLRTRYTSSTARYTTEKLNTINLSNIVDNYLRGNQGFTLQSNSETEQTETAIYGKVNYRATDPLTVIAGGRISNFDTSNTNKVTHKTSDYDESAKFTGYGALVYQLSPKLNAYTSYTQVYNPQTEVGADGKLLKPREGEQWEVGLKGSWNNNASARLSLYQLDDKNAAAPTTTTGVVAALGERRMRGVELEANGNLTDNFTVSGGYSYLDTDIKKVSSSDNIFLLMPKHTANLWGTYDWHNNFANPITVGLGVNYIGEFEAKTSIGNIKADSATTVDAMIKYPFSEKLQGQLNFYNLLDEDYYARVGSANTFNIPGDGREIKASLTYSF